METRRRRRRRKEASVHQPLKKGELTHRSCSLRLETHFFCLTSH